MNSCSKGLGGVLKPLLAALLIAWVGAGCAPQRAPSSSANANALEIQLQGVVVRQYRGAQRRFEFRAAHMRVRELSESLEAGGGVQGLLEPALWNEDQE